MKDTHKVGIRIHKSLPRLIWSRLGSFLMTIVFGFSLFTMVGCANQTTLSTTVATTLPSVTESSSLADTTTLSEPAYDRSSNLNILPDQVISEISPYIYGQFIEHIETCIYNGIWAEMILDRKFYYPVGYSGFSPWRSNDLNHISMTDTDTVSGGHAVVIETDGDIYQNRIALVKDKEYSGYFYAKTLSGTATVTISLTTSAGDISTSVIVDSLDFQKYSFQLLANANYTASKFSLAVEGATTLFDSLSLMPADNYYGMRRDTLNLLKELNSTMYRWPGGNFLSGYDWKDGIGDRDRRESKRNLHYMGTEDSFINDQARETSDMVKIAYLGFYGAIEPNDYGLDEFLKMCDYLETDVMMMVNTGLGSIEDGSDLVEYCNGSVATEYGQLRAENGHPEPYDIRYWGVGNEMFGSWQLGHVSLSEYVIRHNEFSEAMLAVDPTIHLIASGNNHSSWTDGLLQHSIEYMDYSAEHMYALRDEMNVFNHLNNVRSNLAGRIQNHRNLQTKYHSSGADQIMMALTEYAYSEVVCPSRLKDGLGIGVYLNLLINNADVVKIANYSSTVNATQGCITTTNTEAVMQGSGYALKLYRNYMESVAVKAYSQYSSELQLDVSAAISEDGKTLTIAVVNPSEYRVRLQGNLFADQPVRNRHTFTGDFFDSFNSPQKAELYEIHEEYEAYPVVPAMSLTIFVIDL